MTTCAFRKYKDHVEFAADTYVSNGFASQWIKLYKFKDGIGCGAGSLPNMMTIRNDIKANGFDPNRKLHLKGPDFLFWSFKYGRLFIYGRADPWILMDRIVYHVTGSGHDIAVGALAMGATPKQAVLIACKHDDNTKLPITTMSAKF